MSRRHVADTFTVSDERGNRHRVQQIDIYETGRLMSGGESISDSYFELSTGERIEGTLGNQTFFSSDRSVRYTRT
jgi:hypothetical protein